MRFPPRGLSTACIVFGLILIGVGAHGYLTQPSEPGASIDEPERDLDGVETGREHPLEFTIRNPTGHAIRVVGLSTC